MAKSLLAISPIIFVFIFPFTFATFLRKRIEGPDPQQGEEDFNFSGQIWPRDHQWKVEVNCVKNCHKNMWPIRFITHSTGPSAGAFTVPIVPMENENSKRNAQIKTMVVKVGSTEKLAGQFRSYTWIIKIPSFKTVYQFDFGHLLFPENHPSFLPFLRIQFSHPMQSPRRNYGLIVFAAIDKLPLGHTKLERNEEWEGKCPFDLMLDKEKIEKHVQKSAKPTIQLKVAEIPDQICQKCEQILPDEKAKIKKLVNCDHFYHEKCINHWLNKQIQHFRGGIPEKCIKCEEENGTAHYPFHPNQRVKRAMKTPVASNTAAGPSESEGHSTNGGNDRLSGSHHGSRVGEEEIVAESNHSENVSRNVNSPNREQIGHHTVEKMAFKEGKTTNSRKKKLHMSKSHLGITNEGEGQTMGESSQVNQQHDPHNYNQNMETLPNTHPSQEPKRSRSHLGISRSRRDQIAQPQNVDGQANSANHPGMGQNDNSIHSNPTAVGLGQNESNLPETEHPVPELNRLYTRNTSFLFRTKEAAIFSESPVEHFQPKILFEAEFKFPILQDGTEPFYTYHLNLNKKTKFLGIIEKKKTIVHNFAFQVPAENQQTASNVVIGSQQQSENADNDADDEDMEDEIAYFESDLSKDQNGKPKPYPGKGKWGREGQPPQPQLNNSTGVGGGSSSATNNANGGSTQEKDPPTFFHRDEMCENEFQEFLKNHKMLFDNGNDEVELVKLFSMGDNLTEKYHDDAMDDKHLNALLERGVFGGETEGSRDMPTFETSASDGMEDGDAKGTHRIPANLKKKAVMIEEDKPPPKHRPEKQTSIKIREGGTNLDNFKNADKINPSVTVHGHQKSKQQEEVKKPVLAYSQESEKEEEETPLIRNSRRQKNGDGNVTSEMPLKNEEELKEKNVKGNNVFKRKQMPSQLHQIGPTYQAKKVAFLEENGQGHNYEYEKPQMAHHQHQSGSDSSPVNERKHSFVEDGTKPNMVDEKFVGNFGQKNNQIEKQADHSSYFSDTDAEHLQKLQEAKEKFKKNAIKKSSKKVTKEDKENSAKTAKRNEKESGGNSKKSTKKQSDEDEFKTAEEGEVDEEKVRKELGILDLEDTGKEKELKEVHADSDHHFDHHFVQENYPQPNPEGFGFMDFLNYFGNGQDQNPDNQYEEKHIDQNEEDDNNHQPFYHIHHTADYGIGHAISDFQEMHKRDQREREKKMKMEAERMQWEQQIREGHK